MDRRRYVRHEVVLPMRLGAEQGTVLEMSIGGALFEGPSTAISVGTPIEFCVTFGESSGDRLEVRCNGVVVRVEPGPARPRIATSIDSFNLASDDFALVETEH